MINMVTKEEVIQKIDQLIQDMQQYRKELIAKHREWMEKIAIPTRQIVDTFKNVIITPEYSIIECAGNKFIVPKMDVSPPQLPLVKYQGELFPFRKPHTVRDYDLIAPPVFQFDVDEINKALNYFGHTVIRNLLFAVYPKDVGLEASIEDAVSKYFAVEEVNFIEVGVEDHVYPEWYDTYFLDKNNNKWRVAKFLAGYRSYALQRDTEPAFTNVMHEGIAELVNLDTNQTYQLETIMLILTKLPKIDDYDGYWVLGRITLEAGTVFAIKFDTGYIIVRGLSPEVADTLKAANYVASVTANVLLPGSGPLISGILVENVIRRQLMIG